MRILITGGAGFIGSHIVDECVRRGYDICVIDNLFTGKRDNIAEHIAHGKITFHAVDICDPSAVEKVFQEFHPEVVFHLAAQINVRAGIEKPSFDAHVNIL
jgi:UDP-glucose 4-epimerase